MNLYPYMISLGMPEELSGLDQAKWLQQRERTHEATVTNLLTLKKQLLDLMTESRGVTGLHLNGNIAEWDWLIDNEWLSSLKSEEPTGA
jgi:hypothetical protein